MGLKRLFVTLIVLLLSLTLTRPANASSPQAYQDFLFQFDIYRQKFSDYRVALGEFKNIVRSQASRMRSIK